MTPLYMDYDKAWITLATMVGKVQPLLQNRYLSNRLFPCERIPLHAPPHLQRQSKRLDLGRRVVPTHVNAVPGEPVKQHVQNRFAFFPGVRRLGLTGFGLMDGFVETGMFEYHIIQ